VKNEWHRPSETTIRLDSNVKICFITAGEAKTEVLRELYSTRDIRCFIKKPVTIDRLVRRVKGVRLTEIIDTGGDPALYL
jgi:two-component SAPR family response regulator